MVMASKRIKSTTVYLDERDHDLIRQLSKRTRIPTAAFIREGLKLVVLKYRALLDDPTLELGDAEAAPAHAALIAQTRGNKDTIRPHEGLQVPGIESPVAYAAINGLPAPDVGGAFQPSEDDGAVSE